MKKEKIKNIIQFIIIILLVFAAGFIGSIMLVNHNESIRINDLVTTTNNFNFQDSFLGMPTNYYYGRVVDGVLEFSVKRTAFREIIPFICGGITVITFVILNVAVNKFKDRNKNNGDKYENWL